jgi:protein-tyrosine phosphatase
MMPSRDLDWPACLNARDLGGLGASDGGTTRFGAVVRSDHPSYLTDEGRQAVWDHGIRTVISLETDRLEPESAARNNLPLAAQDSWPGMTHMRLRIEDGDDAEFMARWAESGLWTTPLYFADALERWPARHAALVHHVARSRPGGVLIHCGRGCDRTGLATFVLLALAGVAPEDIAADYASSATRLASREPEYQQQLDDALTAHDTSVEEVFAKLMTSVDVEDYLLAGGVTMPELTTVRQRLLV